MKTMYKQGKRVWDACELNDRIVAEAVAVVDGAESGALYKDVAYPFKNVANKDVSVVFDDINHPKRYIKGGMECIDAIEAAVSNLSGKEGFLVGQIIKYVWRYREKDAVSSLEKAEWYLKRLIESVKANG